MTHIPTIESLEKAHRFPTNYIIKVIGAIENDFAHRVSSVVSGILPDPSTTKFSSRSSANGRHVAVTVEATVDSATTIQRLYQDLLALDGLVMLL